MRHDACMQSAAPELPARAADRVARYFSELERFRRDHPEVVRDIVATHARGRTVEQCLRRVRDALDPYAEPLAVEYLLLREGVDAGSTYGAAQLALFALARGSSVGVLRAGTVLRSAGAGRLVPAALADLTGFLVRQSGRTTEDLAAEAGLSTRAVTDLVDPHGRAPVADLLALLHVLGVRLAVGDRDDAWPPLVLRDGADVATALRTARERSGQEPRVLAQEAHVPVPALHRFEEGTAVPAFATLHALLTACDHGVRMRRSGGEGSVLAPPSPATTGGT